MKWPVIWTSHTTFVDEDTGEQITKHNAKTNYIIIKKDKYATFNYNKTAGHIENTVRCRKRPQLELFTTDNT